MTEKELKKLNRYQLLELLVMQAERADDLQQKLDAMEKLVSAQELQMSNLGSVADAAIQVSGILEATQKAADLYMDAARRQAAEIVQEARRQGAEILARAEAKAKLLSKMQESKFDILSNDNP